MSEPNDRTDEGQAPDETRQMPTAADESDDAPAAEVPGTPDAPESEDTEEPEEQGPYLKADNLKAHGHHGTIIEKFSVSGDKGQIVAVTGNADTGRTTALLSLSGRFQFDTGVLTVGGEDNQRAIRQLCAMPTAEPAIHCDEYHTIRDIALETEIATQKRAQRSEIENWISDLGVSTGARTLWGHLSQYDKKLVGIALAAAENTPVIMLDDVDAGLDVAESDLIFGAVRSVADRDRLVVVSCVRGNPPADTVIALR
ncbi:ATP-binding cassette domain-containing protein [Haloglycomyces albus]|uniref:ATP-binding cassette domain-containing protein n=1 Tax=Haloglycomyces albus TaxID=526067 RepID=UPI00046D8E5D|nr:ATP-binding cassette domain-containing protein [Haloglycomyces albus]